MTSILCVTVPTLSRPAAVYCDQQDAEKCWLSVSEEFAAPRGERQIYNTKTHLVLMYMKFTADTLPVDIMQCNKRKL